jgi:lipoprotein-anchoring transpeptidase ErfK/SrfK
VPAPAAPPTSATRPTAGFVATARAELPIYATPGDATPAWTFGSVTQFGSPTTVLVVAAEPDGAWLEVAVPVRPNGTRGFVRRDDVELARVQHAVWVDLASRTLRLVDADGAVLLETPVAIGSPENPTPTGDFFVTDVIDTGDEGSDYGRYAMGTSGRSPALTEFAGGDGQIGIHGTNQPWSIGEAVSHGCIRVPNDVAARLAAILPLGSPVSIR